MKWAIHEFGMARLVKRNANVLSADESDLVINYGHFFRENLEFSFPAEIFSFRNLPFQDSLVSKTNAK